MVEVVVIGKVPHHLQAVIVVPLLVQTVEVITVTSTPITDRAIVYVSPQDYRAPNVQQCVPLETCRDIERVANQLVANLNELRALVKGESPQLLNEDSGGDARLDASIDKALAAFEAMKGTT